ncbi:MAG: hypothetical protein ACD_21C00021G0003 [uncultured bacterium]|nr:MAG: hypothetical protein ACD_21C00021G0003 [uncultured bacterium]
MKLTENKLFRNRLFTNLNELARRAQKKMVILVLAALGSLIFVGWIFMHSKTTGTPEKKEIENAKQQIVRMDGTADSQFAQDASQKVLEDQQSQIKELHEQLEAIGMQMDALQKTLDEKNSGENDSDKQAVQALQTRIEELEGVLNKKPGSQPNNAGFSSGFGAEARGITTINFSYADEPQSAATLQNPQSTQNTQNAAANVKTVKDYVPPGTFARAVLLSGADTNAGVHGQADTAPITMRILDNGTLPNGEHSSLKGCFVTAAAYGDASSERGQIRLQRLSCVRKPGGHVLDVAVEGTINDMGGSDGIRGHVVMRNNRLIWNAGVSGVLSGIGNAMQQSLSTQSISPLGSTSTIPTGKIFQAGAYGGANTALGKLADYYIKLAEMYHPIVQVHAGSQVNIVFLKGFSLFSLTEGQPSTQASYTEKTQDTTSIQSTTSQNLMPNIKDARFGQEIDVNNSINGGEMQ